MDTLTRRRFLTASGVTAAGALAAGFSRRSLADLFTAARQDPLPTGTAVLVLVTLYGGNDGLNTVIPYADPAYHAGRPGLAYPADEVRRLDDSLGLNPAMKGLETLWRARRLAVVRGVGYPKPDRSHFRSMDIWQTASPDRPVSTGWIGRWLDATGTDPLRAVSIGAVPPPLIGGERSAGAAVPLSRLAAPTGALGRGLAGLARTQAGEPRMQAAAAAGVADLLRLDATYGPVVDPAADAGTDAGQDDEERTNGASAGGQGALGSQLDVVATCIAARVPTRVYAVSLGGFDTHANEKGTQARLLGELDAALARFVGKIGNRPVVVAVYSEFGRRVQANAGDGTDHGTASDVLVLGPQVRGGMYGEQPSLTKLDRNGDLVATTDFRDVYATLLEQVLGTDAERILPGSTHRLAFLAA